MLRDFVQRAIDKIASAKDKEWLFMTRRDLTLEEVKALAGAIKNAEHSVNLDVCDSNLGTKEARVFAEAIKEAKHPVKLYLSENNIGDEGARALAGAIAGASSPVTLNLNCNDIRDEGARALADAIKKANVPVILQLEQNNISPEGVKALAEAIRVARHRVYLSVDGCESITTALHINKIKCATVPVEVRLSYQGVGEAYIGDAGLQDLADAVKEAKIPVAIYIYDNDISEGFQALRVALRINKIRCEYPVNAIKEFLSTVPCGGRGVLCGAIANHTVPKLSEEEINKYLGGYTTSVSKEQASKILSMTLFCDTEGDFKDIPVEIREFILLKLEEKELEGLVLEVCDEIKHVNSNATGVGGASDGEKDTEVVATDENPDDNSGGGDAKKPSDSLSSDSNAEAQESSNATNIFYADSPKELVLRLVDTVEELSGKEAKEYEESIQELESEQGLANITLSQFPELDIPEKYVDTQHVLGGMVSVGS